MKKKELEELDALNRKIEENPEDAKLYFRRGYLYDNAGKKDKALSDYSKAIELDASLEGAYNNRGNIYEARKDYENALADYNQVFVINPSHAMTYNNRGVVWERMKDYERAIADYNKALELEPSYALALKNRGNVYSTLGELESALSDYKSALSLYEKDGNTSMVTFLKTSIAELEAKLQAAAALEHIDQLMSDPEMAKINETMKENRASFNTFIEERPVIRPDTPRFHVLRRWNSYTPIIAKNPFVSKGGGYFLETRSHGVVVDPGFNFIDNFQQAGFRFNDMDVLLITHAHNDHTTDLESILTLLHKYNETVRGSADEDDLSSILGQIRNNTPEIMSDELERRVNEEFAQSPRHKRLHIYMTASTFKKYANFLELRQSADYTITLIQEGDVLTFDGDLEIRVLYAKHNDILSDRDSVGFLFLYRDLALLYTGDTGFDKRVEEAYEALKKDVLEGRRVVLLAHIGGFKPYEENYKMPEFNNGKAFYKNHLGRLGLARLAEILEPQLCIISEFGEEFTECREQLTGLFQKYYPKTRFLPADIGFSMDLDLRLRAVTHVPPAAQDHLTNEDYAYIPPEEVATLPIEKDGSLRYFRKGLNSSRLAQKHF